MRSVSIGLLLSCVVSAGLSPATARAGGLSCGDGGSSLDAAACSNPTESVLDAAVPDAAVRDAAMPPVLPDAMTPTPESDGSAPGVGLPGQKPPHYTSDPPTRATVIADAQAPFEPQPSRRLKPTPVQDAGPSATTLVFAKDDDNCQCRLSTLGTARTPWPLCGVVLALLGLRRRKTSAR